MGSLEIFAMAPECKIPASPFPQKKEKGKRKIFSLLRGDHQGDSPGQGQHSLPAQGSKPPDGGGFGPWENPGQMGFVSRRGVGQAEHDPMLVEFVPQQLEKGSPIVREVLLHDQNRPAFFPDQAIALWRGYEKFSSRG